MRLSRTIPIGVLAVLFTTSLLASYLLAQDSNAVVKDVIPKAALLTDRGADLANRLRFLRNSEARMGKKHPSYESVQTEIEEIKRELVAWAPMTERPFETGDDTLADSLPSMNDRDLRQLVVQLVGKIELLEDRVSKLEQ